MKPIIPILSLAIGAVGAFHALAQTTPATKAPAGAPAGNPAAARPGPAAPASSANGRAPSAAGAPMEPTAKAMPPVDPNKVVLMVGDQKLTAGQFEDMLQAFPPQTQAAARGAQRREFAEQFVQLKLMAQEAERRKIDEQPKVHQQLAMQRENLLAGFLFQDLMATTPVDEATERRYYDAHKGEFEEAKAHHILIRFKGSQVPIGAGKKDLTDAEALAKAQAVRKELLAGKDFAVVAKAESDDAGSAANGGDLGSFTHDTMVKEFADAAFSQPIGQVSEPVKTPYGYHLIKVDSREAKTFDQVKADIDKKVRPETVKAQMDALRTKSNVMIDDSFFGPAKAPVTK